MSDVGRTVPDINESSFLLGGRRYKILKKRWVLLLIVSVILALDTFSASFFGFINDITSLYFEVSPAVTDLLSTVNMIARSIYGFVLALAGGLLDLRTLTIGTCATIAVGDVMIGTGVSSRNNLLIVTIGQTLNGCGAAMALTVSQMATSNWFPKHERGRAVSLPWIFRRLSPVVSNLVATHAVKMSRQIHQVSDRNLNTTEWPIDQGDSDLFNRFLTSFQIAYFSLSAVALLAFTCSFSYITNYPPLSNGETGPEKIDRRWNLSEEIRDTAGLFHNGQFNLLFMMYVLILSVRPMTEWLVSSVVLAAFSSMSDSTVGIMFCIGYVVGSAGSPTGGLILDKFKRPKLTFSGGILMVIVSLLVFALAIYIQNQPLLFVSYIGITFFRDFCFVCVSHSFVYTLYSSSNATKIRGFSIAGAVPWISLAGYTALIRFVLTKCGSIATVLIPIPFHILACLLYVWLYGPA